MWLLVDILVPVLVFAAQILFRDGWRGLPDRHVQGCDVRLDGKPPHSLQRVTLETPTRASVEFEVRPERWYDEVARNTRLSVEGQVGDFVFDRSLYLLSDDPYVLTGLRFDPELPVALMRLFDLSHPAVTGGVRRVTCRNGVVRAELATTGIYDIAHSVSLDAAALLLPVARRLDAAAGPRRTDRAWAIADRLRFAARALFFGSVVQYLRVGFIPWRHVDPDGWLVEAFAVSALVAVGLVSTAWVALAGTSRRHVVLAEVLPLGSIGALYTVMALTSDLLG